MEEKREAMTFEKKTAAEAEKDYLGTARTAVADAATDAPVEEDEPVTVTSIKDVEVEAEPEEAIHYDGPEPSSTVAKLQKAITYLYNKGLLYKELGTLDTHQKVRGFAGLVDRVRGHRNYPVITVAILGDVFTGNEGQDYADMGLDPDRLVEVLTEVTAEIEDMGH